MTELPMTKLRLKQLYVTRFMKQEGLIKFVTLLEEMLENKMVGGMTIKTVRGLKFQVADQSGGGDQMLDTQLRSMTSAQSRRGAEGKSGELCN